MNSIKPSKELSLSEILTISFDLYKKHFINLIIPFIVSGVISFILMASFGFFAFFGFMGQGFAALPGLIGLIFLAGIVSFIINLIVAGIAIKYTGDVIEGGSPTLSTALNYTISRIVDLIIASIIVSIVVFIGLILLIIPGIILGIMFMLTIHVVMLEGKSAIEAMSRSKNLVNKRWLSAFLLIIIILIISIIISMIPLIGPLLMILAYPYFVVVLTFFYYSMKAKEAMQLPPTQL
ncbi:MAG: hypothetical protein QXQ27_01505 [Nitrososphaerota archaeon]